MRSFETVVVLVNYNSINETQECIRSIYKKEKELPFIIVVDNNSTLGEDLNELGNLYPYIQVIANNSNLGFAKANNQAVKWAFNHLEFNYILILNNDTLITRDAISQLKKTIEKDPDIGIATSRIMYTNAPELVWYGGGFLNFHTGRPSVRDLNQKPTEMGSLRSGNVSFASGCVMMFRKKCWSHLGGFDEEYFMYSEDMELCIRALRENFKIWYVSEVVIYHTVGGSQVLSDISGLNPGNPNIDFHFYHKLINLWRTYCKHRDLFSSFQFIPYFCIFLSYKFFQLMLLSPKRKKIIRVMPEILRFINGYR